MGMQLLPASFLMLCTCLMRSRRGGHHQALDRILTSRLASNSIATSVVGPVPLPPLSSGLSLLSLYDFSPNLKLKGQTSTPEFHDR